MRIFFIATFLMCISARAEAPRQLGLGLALGSPTAITGKYFVSPKTAWDFGLGVGGWSWLMYGDHHWYWPQIFGTSTPFAKQLSGYVGAGAGVASWTSTTSCGGLSCKAKSSGTALLIRGPLGAEWYPGEPRIGVFLELVPVLAVANGIGLGLDFQLGGRYYF